MDNQLYGASVRFTQKGVDKTKNPKHLHICPPMQVDNSLPCSVGI